MNLGKWLSSLRYSLEKRCTKKETILTTKSIVTVKLSIKTPQWIKNSSESNHTPTLKFKGFIFKPVVKKK